MQSRPCARASALADSAGTVMSPSVGYARVSTEEQNLDLQLADQHEAGCVRIFQDKASGASGKRPGLSQAVKYGGQGDVLVVWKLDRLGRSLLSRGIGLKVLAGHGSMIDTTRQDRKDG